jgi:hypothetical protein
MNVPADYDQRELEADTVSAKMRGLEAIKGGITTVVRELIKNGRHNFFMSSLLAPGYPDHQDREYRKYKQPF